MSQQINLFNPIYLKQEKVFSARTMAQGWAAVAIGLCVLAAWGGYELRSQRELAASYATQVERQRTQLAELTERAAARTGAPALAGEVQALERALEGRRRIIEALGPEALGETGGFSGYFASLARQSVTGLWLTGFTLDEGGNMLRIEGRVLHADLVPAYLKALNAEPVMRGRSVTDLRLTARDESAKAAPGAPPAAAPARFVEFSVVAPRTPAPPRPAAGAEAKR